MTPRQIALVRGSYDRIAPHLNRIGMSLCESLLRFHPELDELVDSEFAAQGRKWVAMLATVMSALDRPAQLHPIFFALGEHYAFLGVHDEHYDIVGGALITALRPSLDPTHVTDTEVAWTALYAEAAASMIAGARWRAKAS
jgi:hemoglobin-like flavoprotein